MSRPEVFVDGWPLSSLCRWGALRTSTRQSGEWEAVFHLAVKPNWRHPAFVYGAPVDVKVDSKSVFAGSLPEPDWASGDMAALGACRQAENAHSITGAGVASTKPDTVVDAAITRGVLAWVRAVTMGTTAVGEADGGGGLVTIDSVLDAWAEENATGWAVWQRRLVEAPIAAPDPVDDDPDWLILPGAGELGRSADQRVDKVAIRFRNSAAGGALATAYYPSTPTPAGGVERSLNLTTRRLMTTAEAQTIGLGEWSKLAGRSGFTGGLTVARGQVLTPGGQVAELDDIRAGDVVRQHGVSDEESRALHLQWRIGDTDLDWEARKLSINPVGMSDNSDESLLEAAGQLAANANRKAAAAAALAAS